MIPGDYDYNYDNIGNRWSYRLDADPATTYTTNNVNQYTATAYPTASFDYDRAGNLLRDRFYSYTWDAENRLVSAEITYPDLGSADKKLVFSYDYMGRRVRKQIFAHDPKGEEWQTTPELDWLFLYDRWNVIIVLDALDGNATVRKYTWGPDLSGQAGNATVAGIHGAGGIGGLLAAEEPQTVGESKKYWYLYDANGNVGQIVQNATGYPIVAHYEYDAYGTSIVTAGSYAAVNPIRFSTKWLDYELGKDLVEHGEGPYYYGYRYYSPRLGRWLSRDPIGEQGGPNLYGSLGNSPLVKVDPLGLTVMIPDGVISIPADLWYHHVENALAGKLKQLSFCALAKQALAAKSNKFTIHSYAFTFEGKEYKGFVDEYIILVYHRGRCYAMSYHWGAEKTGNSYMWVARWDLNLADKCEVARCRKNECRIEFWMKK